MLIYLNLGENSSSTRLSTVYFRALQFWFIFNLLLYGCFACMRFCAPHVCLVSSRGSRGSKILWNWSHRWVWSTVWVLGNKPRSLNHWVTSPAPALGILKTALAFLGYFKRCRNIWNKLWQPQDLKGCNFQVSQIPWILYPSPTNASEKTQKTLIHMTSMEMRFCNLFDSRAG